MIVFFCALFVYRCVMYCCHRLSTQMQLTNTVYQYILLRVLSVYTDLW
jgi:hypothetical protein